MRTPRSPVPTSISARPFAAPPELVIAWARLGLCLISLLAVYQQWPQPTEYSTSALFLLSAYAVFSGALVALNYGGLVTPIIQQAVHFADVVIIATLLFLTNGSAGPSLLLFLFVVLAAGLQWSWLEVITTAAAMSMLLVAEHIIHARVINGSLGAGVELTTAIIRASFLIVVGGMLAYVCASRQASRQGFERLGSKFDWFTRQPETEAAIAAREKMRLAQNLHDGVLQSLTAANLQLSLVDKTSEGFSRLELVKELLTKEQRNLRNFVDQAYGREKRDGDIPLGGELQQIVHDTGRYWDCATSFSAVPDGARIPKSMGDQISLMVAEAIANAARHGGASKIEVAMERTNGCLGIGIRDNGKGFGSTVEREHAQPASIHGRVCALGGSLQVKSSAQGSELAIRVPVP